MSYSSMPSCQENVTQDRRLINQDDLSKLKLVTERAVDRTRSSIGAGGLHVPRLLAAVAYTLVRSASVGGTVTAQMALLSAFAPR